MSASALLERLRAQGATVATNGARLKLAAPPGVLVPELVGEIQQFKPELLELLRAESKHSEPAATFQSGKVAEAPEYSERLAEVTGKDVRCVACNTYCGTHARCAFCIKKASDGAMTHRERMILKVPPDAPLTADGYPLTLEDSRQLETLRPQAGYSHAMGGDS